MYTNRDIKQRQAARPPYVVFVAVSHYQSLQIVVLLLQACLLGSLALSRTLLLQQLHRLQTVPPVSTLHESLQLLFEDRQCCKFIRETVEMFSPVPVETTVWRPLYILILAV